MKFDFTPDPKVLIALTHTSMKPLDALCELIDNAIDSFYSAKIQGITIDNPMVIVNLPTQTQLSRGSGILRIQDNGPGMTADNAEKAIKAGFSGNNPYDTLGLFGMGFNISTGKLGKVTTFMTTRADMGSYIKTVIDLEKINNTKDYSLDAEEHEKNDGEPFGPNSHGTIIEVTNWWPEGNPNRAFLQKLIHYGVSKIREEIGRRYATILRKGGIRIMINNEKCEAYEHCVWDDSRFVEKQCGKVPAVMRFDQVVGTSKRCGKCMTILGSDETCCPSCNSTSIRTIEEKVVGWIGIQRFDSGTDYGIDLIRNGRAIKIGEKSAFFEFVDEFKRTIRDYPIDSQYGRIVGEIHLDFVPVDFLKQDFQRSSVEWQKAMTFLRGNSSLQPTQPGASENTSPLFRMYQAYRRVRNFGKGDMYMGYWDADSRTAKRISRDIEKDYYEKFKQKLPGFYDDTEWWKLVESADMPPVEELPECPYCGTQNVKEAEICAGCDRILKGKVCVNEECAKTIPLSATSCPFCGKNQIPVLLEPWTCKVCRTKNVATDDVCKLCQKPRGTNHPLSKEELLAHSDKDDSLSSDSLSIKLADGCMSNAIQLGVYSTHSPMVVPGSNVREPIIIHKELGKISIFVDNSHPFFTRCALSKEQLIASEVAMYIYQERLNLASMPEHNLSNLTWSVLETNWRDSVEIDFDTIFKEATDLLFEIQERIKDGLGGDAELLFDELTDDEKKAMTNALIQNGIDLSLIGEFKKSGEYISYTPFSFLLRVYSEEPDIFFGGRVWNTNLVVGGEDILGPEIIASARAKKIDQYGNYLKNLIIFVENRYSDMLTLKSAKISIQFLRKDLSE